MKIKNITSIGEFGLIDIIKNKFVNTNNDSDIIVNIGDDSFCFKLGNMRLCISKDMLIEDVHFKKDWIDPEGLGKKSIEVNVSDIAAMGAVSPRYAFIGLGLPQKTSKAFFIQLYKGFKGACDNYNMAIVGGDFVKSDKIVISVTIVGIVNGKIIKRSGAKFGDLIGVTNFFGDAGAGFSLLYRYGTRHKFNRNERILISKQNNPKARLKEAWKMSKYLTSLIDASDGLYVSIDSITKHSGKGAEIYIDKIPVSLNLKNVFRKNKEQLNFALFGSEDYELVFTVPNSKASFLKKLVPQISYIGKITTSKKVKYFYDHEEQKIKYFGYKHF
ncbi:MAG: thiamine-phosphate kinase [Endomicrobium sp.]|jgi:thiamine-monophosphate kinase|nr:thiamine-phosphate kinase [Endomicrobium sp.]